MPLASIDEILSELKAGRAIVLVDDEQRENEGDFVVAAEKITPEMVNFLTRIGGGYLCVALDGAICDRLELELAPSRNNARSTAFTVSVEGHPRHGIGTGVSAKDRATTIRLLSDPTTGAADFTRPGHVNPLRARCKSPFSMAKVAANSRVAASNGLMRVAFSADVRAAARSFCNRYKRASSNA